MKRRDVHEPGHKGGLYWPVATLAGSLIGWALAVFNLNNLL